MPTSIRQQIIDLVQARLQTITVANGYNTEIGATKVFRWRDTTPVSFSDSELPAINFRDRREKSIDILMPRVQEHELTIEADVITSTATVDDKVRAGIADIIKAIGTDTRWTNGSAVKLALRTLLNPDQGPSNQMDVQHEGKKVGAAQVTFVIVYRTQAFDPYTQ